MTLVLFRCFPFLALSPYPYPVAWFVCVIAHTEHTKKGGGCSHTQRGEREMSGGWVVFVGERDIGWAGWAGLDRADLGWGQGIKRGKLDEN